MKKTWTLYVLSGLLSIIPSLHAQAVATATKTPLLELGAGYLFLNRDYDPKASRGGSAWVDVNLNNIAGLEAEGHIGQPAKPANIGENSFLLGPRFSIPQGKGSLYAKAMVGRGTFINNNGKVHTSASYNLYAFGAGIDYRISPAFKVRVVDAEFQTWGSFKPNGLTPYAISSGLMYSFH